MNRGQVSAAVLTAVGSMPPALDDMDAWTWRGNTSRTTTRIDFPGNTPPGSTVWVTACWFNMKSQSGPMAQAANVNLPGTAMQEAA